MCSETNSFVEWHKFGRSRMLVIVFVHKSEESRIWAVSRRAFYIVAVDILVSVCGTII